LAGTSLDIRTDRRVLGRPVLAFYLVILTVSLPFWPFAWHLALHVLGAAMLIGNAIVMAIWLTIAGFSSSQTAKRQAARAVNVGDAWFTIPGVFLLLINGLAMVVERYGGVSAFTTTPFIGIGLLLLTLTGIVWALRLMPAQLTLERLARAPGDLDVNSFRSVLIGWSVWGTVATILPILAVIVMTTKPTF
jgi:uncharacterized membrane protein